MGQARESRLVGRGENENKEMKRKAEAYLEATEGTRQRIWGEDRVRVST